MGSVVSSENEGPRCSYINEQGRRCWLTASHEDPMHRFNLAEPKGSGGSSLDKKCRCGHSRRRHLEGLEGGGSCVECTSAWAHAFVPKDAETAGEPKPYECSACGGDDPETCPFCAQRAREASDLDARWDAALGDVPSPEPEAPEEHVCKPGATLYYCPTADEIESDCHGGFDVCCSSPERHVQVAPPPRRPPYAVAYAIEGGAQYEIALPGDATVRAVDGALVITHDKPVLAMGQVRPMEGA